MPCELLDFRCFLVNEIIGDTLLAGLVVIILYFIIASKSKLGFDTTIALAFPMLFIFGLAISGFTAIYAFATILVAVMVAWIFNEITGNR